MKFIMIGFNFCSLRITKLTIALDHAWYR